MTAVIDPTDPLGLPGRSALVDEVRALVLAAGTTTLADDELREAASQVATLRARLSAGARSRMVRTSFDAPRRARAAGEPFQLSALNPFGIPLVLHFDGESAHAEMVGDARHEGPPEHLHGGIASWLMDCILGILLQARGRRGVTVQLDVRYLRRTPLDVPLQLGSRVTRTEGRKVWAEGWIATDGEPTVTAEGFFLELDAVAGAGSDGR